MKSDHVGIYTGTDADGNVLEISAQSRGGASMLDPITQRDIFKNSIHETMSDDFAKNWRIYRWKQ